MEIKILESKIVYQKIEVHYKVEINGKEIWVDKWHEDDGQFDYSESDMEIFKGEENLTEDEREKVINYINNL